MVARGRGKIIFTASLLSFQGGINVPGYAAAEVGRRRADQGARQRVGRPRRQRQRDRPRLHRHRQHPGAAGRPGARTGPSSSGSRPAAGDGPTTWPAPRCSWPRTGVGLRQRRRPARRRRLAGPMSAGAPDAPRDIVDAHHHLWVRARHPQPWINAATMAAIDADFTVADLDPAGPAAGVTQTVVVQSISSEAETVDLLRLAHTTAPHRWRRRLGGPHGRRRRRPHRPPPGGRRRGPARRRPPPRPGRVRPGLPRPTGRPPRRRGGRRRRPRVRPGDPPPSAARGRAASPATCPSVRFALDHLGKPALAVLEASAAGPATCGPSPASPNTTAKLSGLVDRGGLVLLDPGGTATGRRARARRLRAVPADVRLRLAGLPARHAHTSAGSTCWRRCWTRWTTRARR